MAITPLELFDTSIAQLQTLVAFLDEQLDGTKIATPESFACKEIARSLGVLIRTCQAERRGHTRANSDVVWCRPVPVVEL